MGKMLTIDMLKIRVLTVVLKEMLFLQIPDVQNFTLFTFALFAFFYFFFTFFLFLLFAFPQKKQKKSVKRSAHTTLRELTRGTHM